MKTLNIDGYEIIYDEEDRESVREIDVISRNFFFLQPFFNDGSKKRRIYCDGTYLDILEIVIKNIITNDEFMKKITSFNSLRNIYFSILSGRKESDDVSSSEVLDEVMMLSLAYLFYDGDGDKIVSFLEDNEDKEKIFNWFKNKERLDVYNSVLNDLNKCLEEYDPSILSNYDYILDTVLEEMRISLNQEEKEQKQEECEDDDLELLSRDDVDKLFIKFLDELKAPSTWKRTYQTMKEEKRIHFTRHNGSKCISVDGKKNIFIQDSSYYIKTFYSLVHEFTHYMYDKESNPLSEFPAIYFEKRAINFLVDNKLMNGYYDFGRRSNNYLIIDDMIKLFNDLRNSYNGIYVDGKEEYLNTKEKFKEQDEFMSKMALEMLNFKNEDGVYIFRDNKEVKKLLEKDKIDCQAIVDKRMDNVIGFSLQNGIDVIDDYSYLLGTYLTEKIIDNSSSEMDQKMFYLATHLDEFNLDNIHEYLGIEKSHNKSLKK